MKNEFWITLIVKWFFNKGIDRSYLSTSYYSNNNSSFEYLNQSDEYFICPMHVSMPLQTVDITNSFKGFIKCFVIVIELRIINLLLKHINSLNN